VLGIANRKKFNSNLRGGFPSLMSAKQKHLGSADNRFYQEVFPNKIAAGVAGLCGTRGGDAD